MIGGHAKTNRCRADLDYLWRGGGGGGGGGVLAYLHGYYSRGSKFATALARVEKNHT